MKSLSKRFYTTRYAAQPVRTTDAARVRTTDPAASSLSWKSNSQRGRFRDSYLNPPTAAESAAQVGRLFNPTMLGRAWSGDLKAQLDAMSAADRTTALDAMREVVNSYGQNMERGTMRPGNAGSLATDEPYVGSGASPQDINDSNKKFWDDMAKNNLITRDSAPPRDATGVKIQAIARANAEFWHAQTAHQRTPPREWGKG